MKNNLSVKKEKVYRYSMGLDIDLIFI